ncbi:TIGR03620 family F420-dependent LLM class oxidoreductase [Streptomyces odontomachi]|uniref:TIGR03620 family F420-dependent LLM class oxidoreductase n=1 Tax=Streptomyces odontomachi TaxID=2944940 RepID=UPI002108C5B4|nr:TIGR03620 family F420-dependent LLM class oxidoreductase [Streptomyces sp. ODS25]
MTVINREAFGRVGIWSPALKTTGDASARRGEVEEAVAELDELGYGTIWLGGSPSVADAAAVVAATRRTTVATGILSIWQYPAQDVAEQVAQLDERAPGRFVLGLGASHEALAPGRYAKPYSTMVAYLDDLDAARHPVSAGQRVLAALGPKMLKLSAERTLGAHPYLVTVDHVAQARTTLGPKALLAPELKVVLDTDRESAGATARNVLGMYLQLPNYTSNLLRLGFTEDDFASGGSDRLLDALFVRGDVEQVKERVAAFHAAGADHVALQALPPADRATELPRDDWRELAAALLD